MCRTVYALMSTVICGIQMLVRVFMTFILMLENLFRMVLQTCYNFTSFMLQLISLVPICIVFILSSRLKCFMCGGGGPCPVNRGGTCDCLMSILAMVIVFFIFRATGVLDKLFYSIGYAKAPKEVAKLALTTGELTECSRNESDTMVTQEEYEFYVYSSPEVPLECENLTDLDTYDLYGDGTLVGKGKGEKGVKTGKGRGTPKETAKGRGTPKVAKSKRTRKPQASYKRRTTTVSAIQSVTRCGDPNAPACNTNAKQCYNNDENPCKPCITGHYPDEDFNKCIMCPVGDLDTKSKCKRCPIGYSRTAAGVCVHCGGPEELVCSVSIPDKCKFKDVYDTCVPCDPDFQPELRPDSTGLKCKTCLYGGCPTCDSGKGLNKFGKCVPCGEVNRPPCDPEKKPCKYPHHEDRDTCLMCDDLTPDLHHSAEENICRICKVVNANGDCKPCDNLKKFNEQGVCVARRRFADNDDKQPDDDDTKVVTDDDVIDKAHPNNDDTKVVTDDDGIDKAHPDDDGIIKSSRYEDDSIHKVSREGDRLNKVSHEYDGMNKVGTNVDTINKAQDDDRINKDSNDDEDLNTYTIGNKTLLGNNQTSMLYYLL